MKAKKFTLIELLAVILIFGILASIGLSISKPSPVQENISALAGMIQRTRAYAIENRCLAYFKIDPYAKSISLLYKDPFDDSNNGWQKTVPGSTKAFGEGVTIAMWHPREGWHTDTNRFIPNFGIMFDQNGYFHVTDIGGTYNADNWNRSHPSGLAMIQDNFAIFDPSNKKNVFAISLTKVGSYEILEGQQALTDAGLTGGVIFN